MSFSEEDGKTFFGPLKGQTAIFLLGDRQDSLDFARTVAWLGARADGGCVILDLDALYSSDADIIFPRAPGTNTTVRTPSPEAEVDSDFATLFSAPEEIVVIDSLNSLYHLMSAEDGRSRGRKFTFAMASLSFWAKTDGKAVVMSMYRRETFGRSQTNRSISNLSDVTASVALRGNELTVRADRGKAWPGGRWSIPIPSLSPFRRR